MCLCNYYYIIHLPYNTHIHTYYRGPGGSSGDSGQEMLARVLSTLLNELDGIGGGGGGGDDNSGMCMCIPV